MALPLPLPPSGILVIDPITGAMNTQWQNYFLQLNIAISSVSAAPNDARYVITQSNAQLTNAVNLGALTTGVLKVSVAAGVATVSTESPVPVSDGGIGVATLAAHGVVIGNAALGVNVTGTGTTGQPLVSNGASADPTYQTLPVGGGGTGAATLAANNVLLGNGTSTLQVVAPGTSGNVLTDNGTTWVSSAPATKLSLLAAASGTSSAAAATNVATVAISGLTGNDTLIVELTYDVVTQTTQSAQLYNATDGVNVVGLDGNVNPIAVGRHVIATCRVRQAQSANTAVRGLALAYDTGGANFIKSDASTFTTAWTGSWTLALRHGGVTAGGAFQWAWSVYKEAGQ